MNPSKGLMLATLAITVSNGAGVNTVYTAPY